MFYCSYSPPPGDLFRLAQPLFNQFNISTRRCSSALRLLLKGVEHIDRAGKADRIHSPKSIPTEVRHDFHHACTAKAAQRFCVGMLSATLRDVQCIAHVTLNRLGEFTHVLAARADPDQRL